MRCFLLLLILTQYVMAQDYADLKAEPHHYWERQPNDRFTQYLADIKTGRKTLPTGEPLQALTELLQALEIPASSQLLVFSATSLQSGLIAPNNPRALYFNEDTYIGYVPGGKLEVLSIDPELGAIMYILTLPKQKGQMPYIDRSRRCMNCHSGDRMHFIPGLAIESVIPDMTGATQEGFRRGQFGHGIPFEELFGGWHVTGQGAITRHLGNIVGEHSPHGLVRQYHPPGELFDWNKYPAHTSDILAHLLHEHQAGFVNLVVEGIYRTRHALYLSQGTLSPEQEDMLDQQAENITRYILFADERPLPDKGITGDETYKQDFLANRQPVEGQSLKDLELKTRLFQYRCSYMIYTDLWDAIPSPLKTRIYAKMRYALSGENSAFSFMEPAEKEAIRKIIHQTKRDLPSDWLN